MAGSGGRGRRGNSRPAGGGASGAGTATIPNDFRLTIAEAEELQSGAKSVLSGRNDSGAFISAFDALPRYRQISIAQQAIAQPRDARERVLRRALRPAVMQGLGQR